MKVKRQKQVRKVLNFYKTNYGHQPPYNILVDGTFCKAALKFQINISEQLPKYLDAEVKLITTKCVMAECEALGMLEYCWIITINVRQVLELMKSMSDLISI